MPFDSTVPNEPLRRSLKDISELRHFTGAPRDFWNHYQSHLAALTGATRVALLVRESPGDGDESATAAVTPEVDVAAASSLFSAASPAAADAPKWRKFSEFSGGGGINRSVLAFSAQLEAMAEHCMDSGDVVGPVDRASGPASPVAIAARLNLHNPKEVCVAALLLPGNDPAAAREALVRLHLAADVPRDYQSSHAVQIASTDVQKFAAALDLMVQVNAETRFLAAALAFCNGLCTRFKCDRVSLGWLEHGYIRLRAISRTEKFDRLMAAAQKLETAMEEAVDQDDEVLWPAPEDSYLVSRDHEAFAKDQSIANLCSLPLRVDDKSVAIITCERQAEAFTPLEVQELRLCCDQVSRRLADLKRHDRWFGARLATATREKLSVVLGPEHTWAKVISLLAVALIAVLFLVPVTYRVEGNFILRSDDVSFLTAPFDGYINEVMIRPGDVVKKNTAVLSLDTSELLLEESGSMADMNRYLRESEKARAAGSLADMRISQALAEQSKARLDLIRYRLERAAIQVPFDGVVVEGDLRERLKAPVKQGDALLKIARLDTLYVEAEISERDIHEVLGRTNGEIAFVTQPKLKFPVRLTRVEPAAAPRKDGNFFLVRCNFDERQPWWRPGMSGVCKINVEKRTLFWIISHRTVDFLRLKLWW